jgi:hypothetical protein
MSGASRALQTLGVCALGAALLGCGSGRTTYFPHVVARGELTLRYDDGFQVYGGNRVVAESYSYEGLTDYVRCVPEAAAHARRAESRGQSAVTLSTLGIVFGLTGMGGLGGLYFQDKDPAIMWGMLGTGVLVAATGVVLGGLSRGAKEDAHGNALDAVNYYNDAVGSLGATCDDLAYPAPAGPVSEAAPAPSGQVPRYTDPSEQTPEPPPPAAPPAAPTVAPPAAPTSPAPPSTTAPGPAAPPNWPDVTPRPAPTAPGTPPPPARPPQQI